MIVVFRAAAVLSIVALLAETREASAVSLVLDEFDSPPGGQSVSISNGATGQSAENEVAGTGAVGGTRLLFVYLSFAVGGTDLQVGVNGTGSPGTFHVSHSTGVDSVVRIYYRSLDLNLMPDFRYFTLEGLSVSNDTTLNIAVEAADFAGGFVSSGGGILVPGGFSGDLRFDRSYFLGDPTRIIGLEVSAFMNGFDNGPGSVQIERFVATSAPIPEPGTALTVLAGLVALASRQRSRRLRSASFTAFTSRGSRPARRARRGRADARPR